MASKGAGGSGSGKGSSGPSKDDNWSKHNFNSPTRIDLSKEEKKKKRNEELLMKGVPEEELKLKYEVPDRKKGQGPEIDALNIEAADLTTLWNDYRQTYYHLLIFGGDTPQAKGDMRGIITWIDEKIKPRIEKLRTEIYDAGQRVGVAAEAVMPPNFFYDRLENIKVPVPLPKGKKKK